MWLHFGWLQIFYIGNRSFWGLAAPGAPETIAEGGGQSPRSFREGLPGLRGRPDPQNDRFPPLNKLKIPSQSTAT